jgi:hypothetical protein
MTIAILGWGSLIWDKRDLPVSGEWRRGGPVVPIEFSRISTRGARAGCLTLVIDEKHGANVTTRFALSPRTNLDDAIADLRAREGTNNHRIGYANLVRGTERDFARQQHLRACDTIKEWAHAQRWQALIWTALPSNFEEVTKSIFSVEAALQHWNALGEPAKTHALDYIRQAPDEVVTPFREALIDAGLVLRTLRPGSPEERS